MDEDVLVMRRLPMAADTSLVVPDENVEIVKSSIEAFNRRDREGAFEKVASDFEVDLSRAEGPVRGIITMEQIPQFWSDFADSWESLRIEVHELIEAGDHVVVPWTMHARGRAGIEVTARVTWVWTIRDGFIVRMSMYQNRQEALDAVDKAARNVIEPPLDWTPPRS